MFKHGMWSHPAYKAIIFFKKYQKLFVAFFLTKTGTRNCYLGANLTLGEGIAL